MRISDALGERIPLAVVFPSGVLNVEYTPSSYTVAELEELQSSERDVARIISSIRRLVVSWDLTDDEGNPVPLVAPEDPEAPDPLRYVPTVVYMKIMRAVNADQGPGEAKRA